MDFFLVPDNILLTGLSSPDQSPLDFSHGAVIPEPWRTSIPVSSARTKYDHGPFGPLQWAEGGSVEK